MVVGLDDFDDDGSVGTNITTADSTIFEGGIPVSRNPTNETRREQKHVSVGVLVLTVVLVLAVALSIGLGLGLSAGTNNNNNNDRVREDPVFTGEEYESRLRSIVALVVNRSISEPAAFDSNVSSQTMAAQYMARHDYRWSIPDNNSHRFLERYCLVVLYFAASGHRWTSQPNFLNPNLDACAWNAENFFLRGSIRGVQCRGGRIAKMSLHYSGLVGTLPPELGHLDALDFLDVSSNTLSGSIPDSFQDLTKLTYLGLHYNRLTGTLPDWIGRYTDISTLALSNNMLEGTLPDLPTPLVVFAADDNLFTGPIRQLSSLQNALGIYLDDNHFRDTLDDDFYHGLDKIIELDMSDNELVGTIPPHLLDATVHPNLTILDLHGNFLNGSLPVVSPHNGSRLDFLALHLNALTGTVPETMKHLVGLTRLDLTSNELGGAMPEELPPSLTYLFLAGNAFTPGPIPASYGGMSSLLDLSLKSTQRTGTIPPWLGNLTNMVLLDLDSNDFHGTLPTELATMASLGFLLLNRNRLSGTVPREYHVFQRLGLLLMEENDLMGDVGFVCERSRVLYMVSDCGDGEVTCSCCGLCCTDGMDCHEKDYLATIEPLWELDYSRGRAYTYNFYDFNLTNR